MEIDLQKLGLTEDSTFAEIQAKISGMTIYSEEEVKVAKDAAAAGSRSAAESKFKAKLKIANKLSDDDAKILSDAKASLTFKELRKDPTLAKFNEADFKLIVAAKGLANLEGDERTEAIKNIGTEYSDRMSNQLPEVFDKDKNSNQNIKTDTSYVPGSLGLMIDNEK